MSEDQMPYDAEPEGADIDFYCSSIQGKATVAAGELRNMAHHFRELGMTKVADELCGIANEFMDPIVVQVRKMFTKAVKRL